MPETKLTAIIQVRDKATNILSKAAGGFKMLGVAAAGAAVAIGVKAVSEAVKFEKAMGNVSTLVDTNVESMDAMKKAVLEMATRVPVPIEDLTESLYDIRSAGISAADAMETLEAAGYLAVAGLGTAKEATTLTTTAINAFGLQSRSAHDVANVLFKTVKAGTTTVGQLSQSFGKMAGNASAAKISFEDAQAATAALTAVTGQTSESQNALAQVFLELTKKGGKLDSSLQAQGSSLEELNKKIQKDGLVAGMQNLREELGLSETEFKNLFSSAEGGTAVYQLLTTGGKKYKETLEDMTGKTDALTTAFEKQNETAAAQFQLLKSKLTVVLINLGNKILPHLTTALGFLERNWDDIIKVLYYAKEAIKATGTVFGAVLRGMANVILIPIRSFYKFQAVLTTMEMHFNRFKYAAGDAVNSIVSFFINLPIRVINALRGFAAKVASFLRIKFPSIKLPHFSISFAPMGGITGRALKKLGLPGKPVVGIKWYQEGGIFKKPAVIGVGEKGPEAVVPLKKGGFRNINVYIQGGYYLDREAAEKMGDLIIDKLGKNIKLSATL